MCRFFRWLLAASLLATSVTSIAAGVSDSELAAQISVKGVLSSGANSTALINGRLVHVGESVGAIEIIAIEPGLVHMRSADKRFAMAVGSSIVTESRYSSAAVAAAPTSEAAPAVAPAAAPAPEMQATNTVAAAPEPDPQAEVVPAFAEAFEEEMLGDVPPNDSYGPEFNGPDFYGPDIYGPVAPGETLSEIAAILAPEPAERANLMTALYAHNPQAFGDDVHLLYAGAFLSVPEATDTPLFPEALFAATEPATGDLDHNADQGSAEPHAYPTTARVMPGDTLSEIAARHTIDGITLNQAMLAIYEANPGSFGGNLNILYAFQVLQLPDDASWGARTAPAAQAEVQRHASLWRAAGSVNSI